MTEPQLDLANRRVLAVMGRSPWPLDDGWKMRSGNLVLGLAARGASVDLIAFGDPAAPVPQEFGRALARIELVPRRRAYAPRDLMQGLVSPTPFSVLNYRDVGFTDAVRRIGAQGAPYDVLLVEDIVMAQYAGLAPASVRFLDMHNVESHLLRRYASLESSWPRKAYALLTASKLESYERQMLPRFDATFVCSDDDRRRLGDAMGRAVVVPNGVDSSYFSATRSGITRSIVFVGSMDYHANISGVLHFVREILPEVRRRCPDVVTYIVGKNPPREILALASQHIVVTGAVPDVRPYVAAAAVVVVPLLVGGGTRLKILESMAMGKAIVSTTVGAEGIAAEDGRTLALADTPLDFVSRTVELLDDPALATEIGGRARELVLQRYEWRASVDRIVSAFRDLAHAATLRAPADHSARRRASLNS